MAGVDVVGVAAAHLLKRDPERYAALRRAAIAKAHAARGLAEADRAAELVEIRERLWFDVIEASRQC